MRGDAVGNLLAEQHSAAARLRALADNHLDRVGPAQVVGVHAVARRQHLIDERLANARAPPASCRHRRWWWRCRRCVAPRPKRLLRRRRQRAEAHAGDGDGDLQFHRLLREARAQHDVGLAALAIALERIAADGGAEEQQIVEMRQPAFRAAAADVVDAGGGGAADFGQRVPDRRWRKSAAACAGSRPSIGGGVVDVEIVELARRSVAAEIARHRPRPASPAAVQLRVQLGAMAVGSGFSTQSAPRLATSPRT